jgi:hypothetical protein
VKLASENAGKPFPVVYIPRKPHSNGSEAFLAVTYVDHLASSHSFLPFLVDIFLHLRTNNCPPQNIAHHFPCHHTQNLGFGNCYPQMFLPIVSCID